MNTNPLSKEQIKEVLPTLPDGYRWRIDGDTLYLVKKSVFGLSLLDKPLIWSEIRDRNYYSTTRPTLVAIKTAAKNILDKFEAQQEAKRIEGIYE